MTRTSGADGNGGYLKRSLTLAVSCLLLAFMSGESGVAQATIPLPDGVEIVQLGIADFGCEHGGDLFVLGRATWTPDRWCVDQDDYALLPSHLPRPNAPEAVGVALLYTNAGDGRFREPACEWPLYLEHEVRRYDVERSYQALSAQIGLQVPTYAAPTPEGLLVFGGGWAQVGEMPPLHGFLLPVKDGVGKPPMPLNWDSFVNDDRPYQIAGLRFGEASESVVVGNFNGQVGKTFAVVGLESETFPNLPGKRYPLVVYREQDGTYEKRQTLPVGELGAVPELVAVGDLTGNGFDDLVVACSGILVERLYVFLSQGDGTFREVPGGVQMTQDDPRALLIGDFDGSGRADLLLIGPSDSQAQMFFGRGDGTFEKGPVSQFGLGETGLHRAAVGDFNREGRLDVVLATEGEIRFYWGQGNGNFTGPEVMSTDALRSILGTDGFAPSMVLPMEVEQISRGPALAVVSEESGEIGILANRGDGTFEAVPSALIGDGVGALTVSAEDPTKLAQMRPADSSVGIISYGPPVEDGVLEFDLEAPLSVPGVALPYDVALTEFTGDGELDIVVSGLSDQRSAVGVVAIQYGAQSDAADGGWQLVDVGRRPVQVLPVGTGGAGQYLAVLNAGSHNISILQYDSDTGRTRVRDTVQLGMNPTMMYRKDVIGDGLDDLVVLYREEGRVEVLRGRDGLTSAAELSLPEGVAPLHLPSLIALADVTGNDIPNLVVVDARPELQNMAQEEAIDPYRVRVFEGERPAGEFVLSREVWSDTLKVRPTALLALGDDEPGGARIVATSHADPYMVVFDRQRDGHFAQVQVDLDKAFLSLSGEEAEAFGLDGIVSIEHEGTLHLIGFSERPDEQGNDMFLIQLEPKEPVVPAPPVGAMLLDVAAGDITGDGSEELIFLCLDGTLGTKPHALVASAGWAAGADGPTHELLGQLPLDRRAGRILVGDVDQDGYADLMVLYPREGKVSIHWGGGVVDEELRFSESSTMEVAPLTGSLFPFAFHGAQEGRSFLIAGRMMIVVENGVRSSLGVEELPLGASTAKAATFLDLPGHDHVGLAVLASTPETHHKLFVFRLLLEGNVPAVEHRQTLPVLGEPTALSSLDLTGAEQDDIIILFRDSEDVVVLGWDCMVPGFELRQAPVVSTGQQRPMLVGRGRFLGDALDDLVVMGSWSNTMSVLCLVKDEVNRHVMGLPASVGPGTRMLPIDIAGTDCTEVLVWRPGTREMWVLSTSDVVVSGGHALSVGDEELTLEWVRCLPGDPLPIGRVETCELPEVALSLRVLVNGREAGEPPGPTIPVGDEVELTYEVTNVGQVALSEVEVTDSILGTIESFVSLAAGESKTVTELTDSMEGQQEHVAEASAEDYTIRSRTYYYGGEAPLSLRVTVDGRRASDPPGLTLQVGESVSMSYEVINESEEYSLFDVEVTDSVRGAIGSLESLGPGEMESWTETWSVPEGRHEHVVEAEVTYQGLPYQVRERAYYVGALGWSSEVASEAPGLPRRPTFVHVVDPPERGPGIFVHCPLSQALWSFSLEENGRGLLPAWSVQLNGDGVSNCVIDDISGDGYFDAVVAPVTGDELLAVWGHAPNELCHWPLPAAPGEVAAGDLEGNGRLDLVVSLPQLERVDVLLNRGDSWETISISVPGRPGPVAVLEGASEGEGSAGVAVLDTISRTVFFHPDPLGAVLEGRDVEREFSQIIPRSQDWYSVDFAVADIDGDGDQDILLIGEHREGREQPVVTVFTRQGVRFERGQQFTIGWHVGNVVLADVEGNGLPDLVVVDRDEFFAMVRVYVNEAGYLSERPVALVAGVSPDSTLVGDLTGNDMADLLVGTLEGDIWGFWGSEQKPLRSLHGSEGEPVTVLAGGYGEVTHER